MRSAAIALMLCAVACSGGGGDPAPPASSLPTVKTLSVASAYTGMTYPITVYLPGGYATSTDAKAVIYAMDDELEGAVIEQARLVQNIDAIVVSIGDLGSDRRFIDFELPGASAYFKFLTLELVPQIESQYRVDKTRRALIGYSLSGLAAVVALLEDNPSARYFSEYVVIDPSLQFNTQDLFDMEQALWDTTHSLPLTVYHCSTANTGPYFDFPQTILSRGYQGLHYQFQFYPLTHEAVLTPCVTDGLRYVFGAH